MAQQKLGRKDYSIAVKTGTDANKTKFAKECVQGESYFATDTGITYTASTTAGASDGTLVQSNNFNGNAISGFDASIKDQTGTAYTLLAGDNGKVVVLNNPSAVTVTVPSGLGVGFNCSFVQKGAGQVSFDNDSGATTINNRQSHTKINAQFGVASIVAYADNVFVLAGDTAS
jgi:hypothetical protein